MPRTGFEAHDPGDTVSLHATLCETVWRNTTEGRK